MAIYHLNAKVISRGKGQSAVAAAAYRSGERLRDEQTGALKYYPARNERIEFTDILAPKDAPEWAHDRNTLWNQAERAEKRKDAQLAREFEIALPHELTHEQRVWLVKDFAREAFVRQGYAADIAIHAPDKESDERNNHAHIMVTMRTLGPEGFAAKKDRSLNSGEQLDAWREQWANLANRHLERHGHAERIDHRSLKEQGIEREPTVHVGYAAQEMAQRGAPSDRMEAQRGIIERNGLRAELHAIDREVIALERQAAQAAQQKAATARAEAAAAPNRHHAPEAAPQPDTGRAAKGAGKAAEAVAKGVEKIADSMASFFENFLGGASSSPSKDASAAPLNQAPQPQPETPPHVREEAERAARMQEVLRQYSREIPPETQRDAALDRERRERERER